MYTFIYTNILHIHPSLTKVRPEKPVHCRLVYKIILHLLDAKWYLVRKYALDMHLILTMLCPDQK